MRQQAKIPVLCRNCGLSYAHPRTAALFGSGDFTFENVGATCATCMGMAKILDATYDIADGVLQSIRNLNLSTAEVQTLKSILESARPDAGQKERERLANEIAKAIPRASNLANMISASQFALTTILSLISIYIAWGSLDLAQKQEDRQQRQDKQQQSQHSGPKRTPSRGRVVHKPKTKEPMSDEAFRKQQRRKPRSKKRTQ